ncbi:thioredoxin domain-containing protein [Cyclospora cayetanensis]|uniref:Thioredoxin domain-containing protein n=1 Tax=Cyclospora cayetanensis TaxID=88456 RepID=A0A1D3D6Y6_9EIME|nr:thioredoxin domain-containing protein [Cyclospora cayetanensis]
MSQLARQRQTSLREKGHGEYSDIPETEFLGVVTPAPRAVCHFYSPRFERCRIMDKHLEILAKAHPETRIFKMNAEKAPFFSTKLQIRSLPTLVFFIDGVAVHSVVGFTELGGVDDFKTATLAKLMLKHKVCDNLIAQISSGSEESDGDN